MDRKTAEILNAINARFYTQNAASFSQTRNAPWEGWRRCLQACGLELGAPTEPKPTSDALIGSERGPEELTRSVLDIACGNLRFESFLEAEYPQIDWRFFALDNCKPLVDSDPAGLADKVQFTCQDIVGDLLSGLPAAEPANTPALAAAVPFDIVVSFGFMHHIPSSELRATFLREALGQVKPGGHLIVSFWQFLNDETKRARIEQTHAEALDHFALDRPDFDRLAPDQAVRDRASSDRFALDRTDLEAGDYLLGWKGKPEQYRYCHHFTDNEIDQLIAQLATHATLIDSFVADGKTGNLNRYVVLRRKSETQEGCENGWPSGYFNEIEPLELEIPTDLLPEQVAALD